MDLLGLLMMFMQPTLPVLLFVFVIVLVVRPRPHHTHIHTNPHTLSSTSTPLAPLVPLTASTPLASLVSLAASTPLAPSNPLVPLVPLAPLTTPSPPPPPPSKGPKPSTNCTYFFELVPFVDERKSARRQVGRKTILDVMASPQEREEFLAFRASIILEGQQQTNHQMMSQWLDGW